MAGLVLEAVGVVVQGEVRHSSTDPHVTTKIEIQKLAFAGDSPTPVQKVTLEALIDLAAWGEISDTTRAPRGRVRMRFEFYNEEE